MTSLRIVSLRSGCPACGVSFPCTPQGNCWCMALPPLQNADMSQESEGCFCPECLKEKIKAQR